MEWDHFHFMLGCLLSYLPWYIVQCWENWSRKRTEIHIKIGSLANDGPAGFVLKLLYNSVH